MPGPRSFDAPRTREAPERLLAMDGTVIELDRRTVIVAVKTNCDGCAEFYDGDLAPLGSVAVVLIAHDPSPTWSSCRHPVRVAPTSWAELEIRSAPAYVVVDGRPPRVVAEGVAFDPVQVAEEIADV